MNLRERLIAGIVALDQDEIAVGVIECLERLRREHPDSTVDLAVTIRGRRIVKVELRPPKQRIA